MEQTRLTPEFCEFLKLLHDHDVKYLVVGGYAISFHGHLPYTKDLDIWVDLEEANARKLADCLCSFFGSSPPLETLTSDRLLLRIGRIPNQLELMTTIDGVRFDACFGRRRVLTIDGITIPMIGLVDLRTNKAASGRPQDLADLDNLPEPKTEHEA